MAASGAADGAAAGTGAAGGEIRTTRLLLRRARMGDLFDLHRVFTQPEAMRYWSTPPHESLDQSRRWLRGMTSAPATVADDYIVEYEGRAIGKAGAWQLPEIGFLLHPDLWGRGLMREALEALIPHLFARHDLPRLTAEADPRNTRSLGLLARLGFRETGRASRTMQWGEEWCDSVYLALDRPAPL
jgi:RimJ/RimL family protein N-acetyltransferase